MRQHSCGWRRQPTWAAPGPGQGALVTEIMHLWRQRFFRRLLEMPRNRKRLLMVLADLVCIPAALWTAMTLKQGTPLHASPDDSWLYLAAILSSVPVFVRLGLYRAVVRF